MKKNLSFLVAGAILGGVVAALATPVSGPRMRRLVRRKVDACSNQLSDAASNLRDTGGDIVRQGKQIVKSADKILQRSPLRAVAS